MGEQVILRSIDFPADTSSIWHSTGNSIKIQCYGFNPEYFNAIHSLYLCRLFVCRIIFDLILPSRPRNLANRKFNDYPDFHMVEVWP